MAMAEKNVLGKPLMSCCTDPMTGFYRTGACSVGPDDLGVHAVCCEMTSDFLQFSKEAGNDLSTPRSEYGFPGLKPGDYWCLCAARWQEAYEAGCAPLVKLEATQEKALAYISLDSLKSHAIDSDINEAWDLIQKSRQ